MNQIDYIHDYVVLFSLVAIVLTGIISAFITDPINTVIRLALIVAIGYAVYKYVKHYINSANVNVNQITSDDRRSE